MASGIHYFARCSGIRRMGPFRTEIQAWEALTTTDGEPQHGATVWPERVPVKAKRATKKT